MNELELKRYNFFYNFTNQIFPMQWLEDKYIDIYNLILNDDESLGLEYYYAKCGCLLIEGTLDSLLK